MTVRRNSNNRIEYGDFQTPTALAEQVCDVLKRRGLKPAGLVEPTCGKGSFLLAALDQFRTLSSVLGVEINSRYVDIAASALRDRPQVRIQHDSFFKVDWFDLLRKFPEPLLVIGNPPWVTNAELTTLNSSNLPHKSNFQNHRGLDAITGKGNFDISEWIIIQCLDWLDGREGTVAMLCKTAVARKVMLYAWNKRLQVQRSAMYLIDAKEHFGASVDACLMIWPFSSTTREYECDVYRDLGAEERAETVGFRDRQLVADVRAYDRWGHLQGAEVYKWRSGIKHDCAKVMELKKLGACYHNGLNEAVELEDTYLYPMLKSSEVAKGAVLPPKRWMVVTQRTVGEATKTIEVRAPRTWAYLQRHAERLDRRRSIIYRNRPQFSIFGVGPYAFSQWKVAISGFYKTLNFSVVPPFDGKPTVLDDTAYFLSCETENEARYVASLLNSHVAQEFYKAFVFWDAKRPITVDILRRLDLALLACELGTAKTLQRHLAHASCVEGRDACLPDEHQALLFD